MRYWKGSIVLSPTRDYPLLRQVLHSGFITHHQLFEFLRLDYSASSRNAFNNRVHRLMEHGLLIRREMPFVNRGAVYSLSQAGVSEFAGRGEHYVQPAGTPRSNTAQSSLHHSLELNEIHLVLKRSGTLVYWMPETEIRSRNDLTPTGYWKYYDAIVTVRLAGQDCRFALEYERTPKAAQRRCARVLCRINDSHRLLPRLAEGFPCRPPIAEPSPCPYRFFNTSGDSSYFAASAARTIFSGVRIVRGTG